MNAWNRAFREGLVAGSLAALFSATALALAGRRELGRPAAPLNAVMHWAWPREALEADRADLRHTAAGLLVHHGASIFWGVLHARAWGIRPEAKRPAAALAGGAAAAAVAAFVDFRLTPKRLTPGFEHRLSTRSVAAVYGCFALGLALGSLAMRRRHAKEPPQEERAGAS